MQKIIKAILSPAFLCCFLWPLVTFSQPDYTFRKGNSEGSGKWYMGREIAPVMSHYAIGWLERSEREQEERTTLLFKNMDIKPGEVVADIGAGSGYHVVRMAPKVSPAGKVFAVDIQQEMLDYLSGKLKAQHLKNVDLVLGTEKETRLPKATVDKMLLVDVYHEFSLPKEMGQSMYQALKPGGCIYLIEYRMEDPEVPIKLVHKMTESQAIKELEAVGFIFEKNIANLPWQHCLVFRKPK
jgi:SAM-dependent methyltransferase